MIFPDLVLSNFCNQELEEVCIYDEGLDKNGSLIEYTTYGIKCNYQSKAKTILTEFQKIVQITGSVYIPGDPFELISEISGGYVVINGVKREIYRGTKARNPDNTVNHVRLELK